MSSAEITLGEQGVCQLALRTDPPDPSSSPVSPHSPVTRATTVPALDDIFRGSPPSNKRCGLRHALGASEDAH